MMRSMLLLSLAFADAVDWVALRTGPATPPAGDGFRCTVASITDGDTLPCAERAAYSAGAPAPGLTGGR